MEIRRLKMTPVEQAEQEYSNAIAAQTRADVDYMAMISGIELEENNEQQEL